MRNFNIFICYDITISVLRVKRIVSFPSESVLISFLAKTKNRKSSSKKCDFHNDVLKHKYSNLFKVLVYGFFLTNLLVQTNSNTPITPSVPIKTNWF